MKDFSIIFNINLISYDNWKFLDSFYNLISQVTTNEEHIDICKRYYVDKESNLKIALHFNYSEINIKKIKQKINKKIKELYK